MTRPRGSRRDWNEGEAGQPRVVQVLIRFVAFLILVAVIVAGSLLIWPQIELQRQLDDEIAALGDKRDAVADRRDEEMRKLGWLRSDPEFMENRARDVLDLYRPGEIIVRIDRKKSGSGEITGDAAE